MFSAKYWLEPISVARNLKFRAWELRNIQVMIEEHQKEGVEAWIAYLRRGFAAPDIGKAPAAQSHR